MSGTKCEECLVGRCQPVAMTYMRRLGSQMVVFPNAPACRCDMCGQTQFDPGFLQIMQTMMENLARDPEQNMRKKTPMAGAAQEWAPVRETGK